MKSRVLLVWIACMLAVTIAHVSMNVGWANFRQSIQETFGGKRHQLYVGFLPVT